MADNSGAPTVSVIMSVRNGAATLDAAVRSLVRQTLTDWELILVDDGSRDDGIARVVEAGDPRIHIVRHQESRGLACRLNEAVDLSRGKFIARMDADDICYPQRLQVQTDLLLSNPQLDLVATKALVFRGVGDPLGLFPSPIVRSGTIANSSTGFYFPHPTWCGKAEWFRTHRYDERMTRAQDQELLMRASGTSCFSVADEILLGYRQERLKLSNSLMGRFLFCRAIWQDGWRSGKYGHATKRTLLHALKFGAETMAVTFGAEELLVRRRFQPLHAPDIARWRDIWCEMTRPDDDVTSKS